MLRRVFILVFGLLVTSLHAQEANNPKTFISHSGEYKLRVLPQDPYELSSAIYRFTKRGKLLWQHQLPFVVFQAGISDAGVIGGQGYGLRSFHTVILRANGRFVLDKKEKQTESRFLHAAPNPHAKGLIFDPEHDRMVIREADSDLNLDSEIWRSYRLSTGQLVSTTRPKSFMSDPSVRSVVSAVPLPGTPLTLVNWWHFGGGMGAVITLVGVDCKSVWNLTLAGDYETGGSKEARDQIRSEMASYGAVRGVSAGGVFRIYENKKGIEQSYRAIARNGSWSVVPLTTRPAKAILHPDPTTLIPNVPVRTVQLTRSFVVPIASKSATLPRGSSFLPLDDGKNVLLVEGNDPRLVTVNSDGRVRKSIGLPVVQKGKSVNWRLASTGKDIVLAFAAPRGEGARSSAFRVDVSTGRVAPLSSFSASSVDSACGFPDGRFVTLTTTDRGNSSTRELAMYGSEGDRLWSITADGYGGKPEDMLSPEDVAIDGHGNVVLIDNVGGWIQRFDQRGKFVGRLELKKILKDEYLYATGIRAIGDDLLVEHESTLSRIDVKTGRLVQNISPRLPDGKKADYFDFQVSSDQKIWLFNGERLQRLSAAGEVDKEVGGYEVGATLSEISNIWVQPNGYIYASDRKTASVHCFDTSGKRVFVARPRVKDLSSPVPPTQLTVTRHGYILLDVWRSDTQFRFDPLGKLLRGKSEKGAYWKDSRLVDLNGRTKLEIKKWPNQDWLTYVQEAGAPDGSVALISDRYDHRGDKTRIAFFTKNGKPLSQDDLPILESDTGSFAYNGKVVYMVSNKQVLVINRKGTITSRIVPPVNLTRDWSIFATIQGFALVDPAGTVYYFREK